MKRLFPSRAAALACLLVCVVAPASLVAVHINRSRSFTIVDEEAHFDYVQRMAQAEVPRLGEQLLPSTNELLRCVGRPPEAFTPPPCHGWSKAQLSAFYHSVNNAQYEAQQPPLYYGVTAILRWPFIHVLGISPLSGTRATGAIWLVVGLLLMWCAASVLGLEWPVIAAGALFLATAPNVVFEASVVTNDSSAVFAGALVALFGALAWRAPGRVPWWAFALVGLIAAGLKAVFLVPVIVAAAMLALSAFAAAGDREGLRERLRLALGSWLPCAGAMLCGAAVAIIGWTAAFHALSLVNPKTFTPILLAGDGQHGLGDLVNNALATLFPFTNSPAPVFQWTPTGVVPSTLWSRALENVDGDLIAGLTIASGLAWLFVKKREWAHWLGLVSFVAIYFGALALGISILKTYGYNSTLPGRYGLSTAVLMVLALIGALRGRAAQLTFAIVAIASFALTFVFILV